jgi:hypothetical protein
MQVVNATPGIAQFSHLLGIIPVGYSYPKFMLQRVAMILGFLDSHVAKRFVEILVHIFDDFGTERFALSFAIDLDLYDGRTTTVVSLEQQCNYKKPHIQYPL